MLGRCALPAAFSHPSAPLIPSYHPCAVYKVMKTAEQETNRFPGLVNVESYCTRYCSGISG